MGDETGRPPTFPDAGPTAGPGGGPDGGAVGDERRGRTIFGRRRGKPLRPRRQDLVDRVLPAIRLDPRAWPDRIDPRDLFADRAAGRAVWLEIGFGHGEHLAAQLDQHGAVAIIGAEYFLNGIARLLAQLAGMLDPGDPGRWPVRVLQDDARRLLAVLQPGSIGRAFILHPDPWPKPRHHKRRLVSPPVLDALAACLADGAELRMASDDPDYVAWMLQHTLPHPAFDWLARSADDWRHDGRNRPDDWPQTKYERKALAAGRPCTLLRFRRRPRTG